MQYLLDGIVHYNDESRILTDNKREVELSLATSRLLNALIDANNSQVSRTELLEKVWEEHGLVASDNNLNRNISLLRKAFLEFSLEDKIETIPKQGFVTIRLYDILGREVSRLVNEYMTAGEYTIDFNAGNLSSGIYFYRMEINGFSDIKKMILIK